jgi:hypothetical protein
MIQVTNLCYDRHVNKTFAVVRTAEFTNTFYVSGECTEEQFAAWVMPTVDRMKAEVTG